MDRPLLLLVEDAPDVALIVQRYGQRAGQDVVHCQDAAWAWEFLTKSANRESPSPLQKPPDVVILDVNLPGESGLELCQRLRAVPAWAGLPVALFSHWHRPEDIALGLDAGADFVLSKDLLCRPADWRQRLDEILTPIDSRRTLLSLSWTSEQGSSLLLVEAGTALNQALRHPDLQSLGREVVQALLRRALRQTEGALDLPANALSPWIAPDGLQLNPHPIADCPWPEAVPAFAEAWAEQVWCLLGTAASTSCRDALAGAISALKRAHPRS